MKFATVSKSILLSLALLLASSAFAATGSKGTLEVTNPLMLGGTTLKPGNYKVEWQGAGPNVEVNILRGKDVVAKVQAHVAELQAPVSNNVAITHENASGPSSLTAIRFQGKKVELDFGEATEAMQMGSSK